MRLGWNLYEPAIWKKTDGVLDFLPPRILTLIAEFWVFVFIIQFFLSQNSAVPKKQTNNNLQILWFISWAFTVIWQILKMAVT